MSIDKKRIKRTEALIQKLAANFIERDINPAGTLTTVTRIEISRGLREARIFVSIWPESEEGVIMKLLAESKNGFYEYMKENLKIKYMPVFEFIIDEGEKARQRVEEVLSAEGGLDSDGKNK